MSTHQASDTHVSRVATWQVRTLGKAVLAATIVSALLGVVSLIVGQGWLFLIALAAGPLILAWDLMTATAPLPGEPEES